MATNQQQQIFEQGSATYSNSSRFFEKEVRDKVTTLYAFVRVPDDLVDVSNDIEGYYAFRNAFFESYATGIRTGNEVIDLFVDLVKQHDIPIVWVEEFFNSMEMDLNNYSYQNIDDTLKYIRGSAEVIGLMLAKILGLDEQSYPYAEMLGRSMQFINMIRDIDEDIQIGRSYFPQEELERYGLFPLTKEGAFAQDDKFRSFVNFQLDRYEQWQAQAEIGFRYIKYRYLVAIKTAADKYNMTARVIGDDPFVVFSRKVKPSKSEIMLQGLLNAILLLFKK